MARSVEIKHLRPEEILAEQQKCSLVYVPVGPLEWHGPAMPYGTDPMAAEYAAIRAAQLTGGVVWPTLYFGTERERSDELLDALDIPRGTYVVGQDFPKNSMKSFYTKEDVFSLILREVLRLLIGQGYKLIVIVNGHGAANQAYQLQRLSVELSNETDSRVAVAMAIDLERIDGDLGHACRMETSMQMAIREENVDLSRLPPRDVKLKNSDWGITDGCTYALQPNEDKTVIFDPRDATAALGRKYLESGIDFLVRQVRQELEGLASID